MIDCNAIRLIQILLAMVATQVFAQSNEPVSAISAARLESLQQASADGSTTAMVELAGIYLTGASGPREPGLAAELYRRAAVLGDADAMFHLGNLYLMGDGVASDDGEAYQLFKQAAEQGHPLAIQNYESLGRLKSGDNTAAANESATEPLATTLDEVTAVQLARRYGLEIDFSGTVDPTSNYQPLNFNSQQTPRSLALKSLNNDEAENIFRQAEQLYYGEGIAKDEAKAITLYRQASRAGFSKATSRLLAIYAAAGIAPPRCGQAQVDDEICF